MAYLRLREVVKSYDGRTNAVDDVSIDVERGEFLTLLGPSGSGKTTTLLMIAGFETPTSGVIELDGHDLVLSKPYERNIGMVFQNYALFPHMTAAKNVVFPLKMRRFPKQDIKARAERMLELVACAGSPTDIRANYPAASSSASRSRAVSCSIRTCFCSMSRWARSTRICASRCKSRTSASIARSASP